MAFGSESISLVLEEAMLSMERDSEISSSKIQPVPPLFKEEDKYAKYCRPKVISIGPIHYGDPKLKRGEQYKRMWASMFAKDHGQEPDDLYKRVLDNIADLRICIGARENLEEKLEEKFKELMMSSAVNSLLEEEITYRSIRELKASAIQIERIKNDEFASFSWSRGFFFNTARLYLRPLILDDSTIPILLNLIAYEMCPDFNNYFLISSFIKFLDVLIDDPEDVKELRKEGILQNSLGSDEQVSEFFNTIGSGVVQNPLVFRFLKNFVEWHYKNKFRIWMAEGYYTHCRLAWTIIALIAATTLLILTFIQTINSF